MYKFFSPQPEKMRCRRAIHSAVASLSFCHTSSLISDSVAGLCDSLELSPLLLQTMNSKTPSTSPRPLFLLLQMWFKFYTSGSVCGEMCSPSLPPAPLCVLEPHSVYFYPHSSVQLSLLAYIPLIFYMFPSFIGGHVCIYVFYFVAFG